MKHNLQKILKSFYRQFAKMPQIRSYHSMGMGVMALLCSKQGFSPWYCEKAGNVVRVGIFFRRLFLCLSVNYIVNLC